MKEEEKYPNVCSRVNIIKYSSGLSKDVNKILCLPRASSSNSDQTLCLG
jgi:hypothetical protein